MVSHSDGPSTAATDRCRRIALGLEPPDLVLGGGRVYSVFTGELIPADVALCGGLVAGLGRFEADRSVDARGLVVLPGLIDAHVHVESSLLAPGRFTEVLVVHGVTTAMIEPHELTNILGPDAVDFFLRARDGLPVDLQVMLPSSVPASPLEQSAARMTPEDVQRLLRRPGVHGLGEVMDYPGVLHGAPIWEVLRAAGDYVKDGHAPGLSGAELQAYLLGGMETDHETTDERLVLERRRLGMWTLVREGSAALDLQKILPFLAVHGTERTALCTDDRHAATLVEDHHIDGMVAELVAGGVSVREAIRAATLNPATLYRLYDRGAVAPGKRADLLLTEDPGRPHPVIVVQQGRIVARDGIPTLPTPPAPPLPATPLRLREADPERMLTPAPPGAGPYSARAIGVRPGSLITEERHVLAPAAGGFLRADPSDDVALLALLERHRGTGLVGTGLVSGLGLRRGALASTVAHDAHHLIVAGAEVDSMWTAIRALVAAGGGLAAAEGDEADVLPLPLAGLMTDRPPAAVAADLRRLEARATDFGVRVPGPFMALSFLSLSVIPALKITVGGLVDVAAQRLVPVLLADGPASGVG